MRLALETGDPSYYLGNVKEDMLTIINYVEKCEETIAGLQLALAPAHTFLEELESIQTPILKQTNQETKS